MKGHIIGGGFGGLAAAAYLIRTRGVSGSDITIYERMIGWMAASFWAERGGGLQLAGIRL